MVDSSQLTVKLLRYAAAVALIVALATAGFRIAEAITAEDGYPYHGSLGVMERIVGPFVFDGLFMPLILLALAELVELRSRADGSPA